VDTLQTIVSVALDLTAALSAADRYGRLLEALRKVIPYNASALLRLEGEALVPLEARGLSPDAMGRRFLIKEHPRLDIISRSFEPVRFPADTKLPDPFDGLLAHDHGEFQEIHACLGCPLRVEGELIGVLTADALDPEAFDNIDQGFLDAVGALAAVELQTANLLDALEKSAERQGMIARDLMRDARIREGAQMVGTSPALERLRRDMELVSRSDFNVLISGETGTGKELVARAVHEASRRRDEPMIYVNCAALPETLAESELFGHVKGAFTGAASDRPGKFEVADGGTLFLDEIGELPLSVQPKLLRVLQEGEIQRVGTEMPVRVDVRVLAATNRDLERAVEVGEFRADLFHRLNVYPLRVPPLRERKDDVSLLAGYFSDLARRRLGLGPVRLAPNVVDALYSYHWPGNVRELENVLSRATLKAASRVKPGEPVILRLRHFDQEFQEGHPETQAPASPEAAVTTNLRDAVLEFQRAHIQRTLQQNDGKWAATARDLGLHRSNLHRLAQRLGLK
jgi:anaerobic nitric oxide reductase transcription regulator